MTSDATMDDEWSLADLIHEKLQISAFSSWEFLPEDAFEDLLANENMRRELLDPNAADRLAIKELKTGTEKACEPEVIALELAQKLNHTHIVKFVAGFQQDSRYCPMFQWVDGGNLREFWEKHDWSRDLGTIRWALRQIGGLADALEHWHNQYQEDC
ncbi:hypothetical protein BU25DRAFT_459098 [Macroventuria anomochaeta]|uniref:Uncharacterized protein n=1 Tax=Macroventuria anomochaeta TaxID=301207 RepID=A0ACB6RYN7_9PLEO|nr:uncharacterized protein BU25DRAFT_459098 [Macroventuria anomochaeta]KAF2626833.1 hypothetical protein BU25DRAFT_459098 [Macroventuria anomochaeta]